MTNSHTIYIDKEQSNAIKGSLIILIVLGHNHVLCPNTVDGGITDFLYQFHIAGFFILPFFYNITLDSSWKRIQTIVIRTWIPYFWICFACWLCTCVFFKNFKFGWEHIWAFVQGTQTPIRNAFGFVFPWFLPTFCTFSIIMIIARKHKWFIFLFTLMAIILWLLPWYDFYILKNTIPFGVVLAISYFGYGAITFLLNKLNKISKWIGSILFIILSYGYWEHWNLGFLYKMFPCLFFFFTITVSPFLNCRFIRILGQNSLGIYLFNVFLSNITFIFLPHTIFYGVIGFLTSLLIPLVLTILIFKIRILRILLFPKSIDELKKLYKYNN